MSVDTSPPILSFPAILRNPGLNNRFAHLHGSSVTGNSPRNQPPPLTSSSKKHRDQNEGKRWLRRKDNARFVGNPHITAASKKDFTLPVPQIQSTFPEPLPAYLSRNVKLPTTPNIPSTDPNSANAGRFSLSLKGMRKDLRRAGGRAQALVRDVESEMLQWLTIGGTVLSPDAQGGGNAGLHGMGIPVGATGTIFEVSRTPLQLVWQITDDAFARYVVHCCARYHEIVSFSKGAADERLTYLLRPNVTRPDRRAPGTLETPPVTDIDYSSNPETDDNIDSDFVSEHELESDAEMEQRTRGLSAIAESPSLGLTPLSEEESWSQVEDSSDVDEFESSSEFGGASVDFLEPRLATLSLQSSEPVIMEVELEQTGNVDPDATITEIAPQIVHGDASPRRRDWTSGVRTSHSPSRSPVRAWPSSRRRNARKRVIKTHASEARSFYEYLFM